MHAIQAYALHTWTCLVGTMFGRAVLAAASLLLTELMQAGPSLTTAHQRLNSLPMWSKTD